MGSIGWYMGIMRIKLNNFYNYNLILSINWNPTYYNQNLNQYLINAIHVSPLMDHCHLLALVYVNTGLHDIIS
jgi:hypothetical protein